MVRKTLIKSTRQGGDFSPMIDSFFLLGGDSLSFFLFHSFFRAQLKDGWRPGEARCEVCIQAFGVWCK